MATNDSKNEQPKPTREEMDRIDRVHRLAVQIEALLQCTYGEAGESFRNLNDDTQDRFLWAAGGMAHDLVNALGLSDLPMVNHV